MLFPTFSFSLPLQPDDVEPFGYGIYEYTDVPTESHQYKKVVESAPVRNEETGVWMQTWIEEDMNDEEKEAADTEQSIRVRDSRNFKLTDSDYTQMSDYPGDGSLWLEYRQALRDLPEQSGFPWDVIWPEVPV